MCPVNLPRWMADSAGFGIDVWPVVHDLGQLEDKYGLAGAKSVWQLATTKVFLPGNSDVDLLDKVSRLSGRLPGDAGDGRNDWVMPLEGITRLPNWRALVIRQNLSPVVVKFRAYWRRLGFRLRQNPPVPLLRSVTPASAYDVDAELADLTAAGAIPSQNGDAPPDVIEYG